MSRTHLLGAASAVALACFSTGAFAQQAPIQGGGSTLAEFDYFVEFPAFNASQPANGAIFNNPSPATGNNVYYWPAGSGSGQAAFLNDDLTCDSNKVLNLMGAGGVVGACSNLPPTANGGTNFVDYGASDATLSSTQISGWASSSYGQSVSGNLIQLPSMGVGVSFPITTLSGNGAVALTDNDLCGIFSGKDTDWSQTSVASKLSGSIQVVYRNDGSGTSFLLLNHFSKVCTSGNSSFPTLPVVPSTTFTSVFVTQSNPTGTPPSNFVGQKGSSGIANYLSGLIPPAPPANTIAYLTPDFTTIDPQSNAVLSNGNKSQLNVAAVINGTNGPVLPTETNIAAGLNSAKSGTNLKPPPVSAGASAYANPVNFVPLIQTTKKGYSVVGYTTFDFAQCYANPSVGNALVTFLTKDHYTTTGQYAMAQINNGFVPLAKSGAKTFVTAIEQNILGNKNNFNDNIQNGTACAAVTGR